MTMSGLVVCLGFLSAWVDAPKYAAVVDGPLDTAGE